ncbi:hypothetical protein BSL78_03133 [Apostichopus japonicus]|uniref:B box-type domain-containing protein n=1 Tax=Stichopus japonicus TaxID=307972 RepID=A0A2G8LI94_STIJA|nr:hypothetical protein BSL78_03133 [Apostichopus japonicus]
MTSVKVFFNVPFVWNVIMAMIRNQRACLAYTVSVFLVLSNWKIDFSEMVRCFLSNLSNGSRLAVFWCKGLPVNFLLVSLMEQLSVVDTSGRSSSICSFCQSEQDLQFCIDCKFHICCPCKKNHDKIPGVSEHAVIPIEKLSDEKYMKEIFASQTPRCDKHQEEKLRFYCLPCCMLVCRDCMLLTHHGHNCVEAASRVSSVKEDLQNLLAASETEVVSAQEMNRTIDKNSQSEKESIKKVEKDIHDHYKKVLRQLKSNRDKLVLQVRHSPMRMKPPCEEVKNWLAAMTNTKEVTKKILEGNNQWEILGMEKVLSEAFKRLSEDQKGLTRRAGSQQSSTNFRSFPSQLKVNSLTSSMYFSTILGELSIHSYERMKPNVYKFFPYPKVFKHEG